MSARDLVRLRRDATARIRREAYAAVVGLALVSGACGGANARSGGEATESAAVTVTIATAVEQPITRFIHVSGTLTAQEDADVAAEIAGRVVATPVERGSRVEANADLIRVAAAEAEAQAVEARANAAQIEARLGIAGGAAFQVDRVPEVANAQAAYDLAKTEFDRVRMLQERQLVSQSEFDQRRSQMDAAMRQYDVARNAAEQQYQALQAAQARVRLAEKAVADTVVRAPFAGVVAERLVSVGDYVTRGMKVVSIVRVDPLRVELTVPQQYVAAVSAGRSVSLDVDAYPGETFTGQVRFVSPSVKAETRALMVEAVVPNADQRLKPGFFATARIEQASRQRAILVPSSAVRTVSGTPRVFVVSGDRVEERVVATGQTVDGQIEIATGVKAGERVAASSVEQLVDGVRIAQGK